MCPLGSHLRSPIRTSVFTDTVSTMNENPDIFSKLLRQLWASPFANDMMTLFTLIYSCIAYAFEYALSVLYLVQLYGFNTADVLGCYLLSY